jgi:hypothetical protein
MGDMNRPGKSTLEKQLPNLRNMSPKRKQVYF